MGKPVAYHDNRRAGPHSCHHLINAKAAPVNIQLQPTTSICHAPRLQSSQSVQHSNTQPSQDHGGRGKSCNTVHSRTHQQTRRRQSRDSSTCTMLQRQLQAKDKPVNRARHQQWPPPHNSCTPTASRPSHTLLYRQASTTDLAAPHLKATRHGRHWRGQAGRPAPVGCGWDAGSVSVRG